MDRQTQTARGREQQAGGRAVDMLPVSQLCVCVCLCVRVYRPSFSAPLRPKRSKSGADVGFRTAAEVLWGKTHSRGSEGWREGVSGQGVEEGVRGERKGRRG